MQVNPATDYPEQPGWKATDTETSAKAGVEVRCMAPLLRDMCLAKLGGRAMTADEVAEALGESVLSVRPRISELKAKGMVSKTAARRCNVSGKTAVVWQANLKQQELI